MGDEARSTIDAQGEHSGVEPSAERLKDLTLRFLNERHQLSAFIQGLVRNRETAEEILQEVWLRLAAAVEKSAEVKEPERWFRGVAKNLILHHFRTQRSAKVVADSRLVHLVDLAFEERADEAWAQRRGRLAECVERLPEKSRDLLKMKYEAGLKVAHMAIQLRRTEDAIMKALSRIRQLLAQCVENHHANGGAQP